jgi:hypothetical protein
MDRYGCEENTEKIPKKFRKFLKQMKLPKMYDVPHRGWSCLTGSGIKGKCHSNAIKLCLMFGGKQMVGYEVACFDFNTPDERWIFNFHSVWITPEGKMTNATKNVLSHLYVGFLPLQINHPEDNCVSGCYLGGYENANRITASKNNFETEGIKFRGGAGSKVIPFDETLNAEDFYEGSPDIPYTPSDLIGLGGFTTPSTASGKTFDEIWMERTGLPA